MKHCVSYKIGYGRKLLKITLENDMTNYAMGIIC
jgi:hypothetical protein